MIMAEALPGNMRKKVGQRAWKRAWKKASSRSATATSSACCGKKIPMETIARITKVSVEQIRELGKLNGML